MTTREWNTAVASGLLRLFVGAGLLRWRRPLARTLAGASPDDRLVPLLFGYFGARDMTVGVVTLAATRPGGNVPGALRLQGIADATDAALVGAVITQGRLPKSRGVVAIGVALVSALAEFAASWQIRRG